MSKPAATAGQAEAEKVKVKITRKEGHRHAGQKYEEGAEISVSPRDAEIIVALKAGEVVGGK